MPEGVEHRPSPMERERILVEAAERYTRGEITLDEHTRIRAEHRLDYVAAIRGMQRAARRWWRFWGRR